MQKVFLSDVLKTIKKAYIWNDEISQQILERAMMQLPPADDVAGWIPVSEGLPEAGEDVLISYHYESVVKNRPSYDGVKISHWLGSVNHDKPDFATMGYSTIVLAWMPLPEPYKEGEQDG